MVLGASAGSAERQKTPWGHPAAAAEPAEAPGALWAAELGAAAEVAGQLEAPCREQVAEGRGPAELP